MTITRYLIDYVTYFPGISTSFYVIDSVFVFSVPYSGNLISLWQNICSHICDFRKNAEKPPQKISTDYSQRNPLPLSWRHFSFLVKTEKHQEKTLVFFVFKDKSETIRPRSIPVEKLIRENFPKSFSCNMGPKPNTAIIPDPNFDLTIIVISPIDSRSRRSYMLTRT